MGTVAGEKFGGQEAAHQTATMAEEENENPEIWKAAAMADHFEKIQKLPEKVDGVPNFRRVPGYKVYCCGQPTLTGFENAINKACGDLYPKTNKIIWLNMRQEPIVYVNGNPICARPPNKIGEYAELGNVTRDSVKKDEEEFMRVVEGRAKGNDGKLKYVDVNKAEHEVEVKELTTLSLVIEGLKEKFPGLVHQRIPVCNSAAPTEADFDTLCKTLEGSAVNCPVIVNCQVGLSRSTTGCVAACLFREFQLAASYEGLIETVPGVDLGLLKMDTYKMDMSKDPLFRGEFEVVKELLTTLKNAEAAKNVCDKVIDKNGTKKTGGTGIKQLRENIAESKLSYEIMDDQAQAFLKTKIMDNIQKYFYLIVFAGYMREQAAAAREAIEADKKADVSLPASGKCSIPATDLKISRSFVEFMEENASLRTLIDTGKGNLQWERDIPPESLANLENLVAKDFQGNLGKIIHDIYQTAHVMFGDMPQGDHKKRAKYRFASKTIMRILPAAKKTEVEELIAKKKMTMDLYEILGKCTWTEPK